jgi:hypothetical protein
MCRFMGAFRTSIVNTLTNWTMDIRSGWETLNLPAETGVVDGAADGPGT